MKHKFDHIVVITAASMIAGAIALPAIAQIPPRRWIDLSTSTVTIVKDSNGNVSSTLTIALQERIKNIQARAAKEIARRIDALNLVSTHINATQKISDNNKAGITASIQSQLTELNTLQTKITVDQTTSTLLSDVSTITSSYRTFVLIISQGAIETANDHILSTVSSMNSLSEGLSARILAAQSVGANVSTAQATLNNFIQEIDSANTQSQAAVAEVAGLSPDNGVQAVIQANAKIVKDAIAKTKAAQNNILNARADAKSILTALKVFEAKGVGGN